MARFPRAFRRHHRRRVHPRGRPDDRRRTGTGAAAERKPLPERLTHIGDSRQVVVVTTGSWTTSYAKLQTWQKDSDGTGSRSSHRSRPGSDGTASGGPRTASRAPARRRPERSVCCAGSVWPAPPDVDLPYRRVDKNDWWPYDPTDPKTYNVLQPHRVQHAQVASGVGRAAEVVRQSQYRYAVVLDYNLPSGIEWRTR